MRKRATLAPNDLCNKIRDVPTEESPHYSENMRKQIWEGLKKIGKVEEVNFFMFS